MISNLSQFQIWLLKNDVLDRFALSQIGLFGSFVRDEQSNDIDLLLDEPIHYARIDELKGLVLNEW